MTGNGEVSSVCIFCVVCCSKKFTIYGMYDSMTPRGSVFAGKLGHRWLGYRLVAFSAPSHYLNQWWFIIHKSTVKTFSEVLIKIQNFDQKTFCNVICKISAILSRSEWVALRFLFGIWNKQSRPNHITILKWFNDHATKGWPAHKTTELCAT